jgi:hypothetical protein
LMWQSLEMGPVSSCVESSGLESHAIDLQHVLSCLTTSREHWLQLKPFLTHLRIMACQFWR